VVNRILGQQVTQFGAKGPGQNEGAPKEPGQIWETIKETEQPQILPTNSAAFANPNPESSDR